jgi:two-component system sensor histidine kinase RpfC
LEELEKLGGVDFLADLITEFLGDAELLVQSITAAAQKGDLSTFRDRAHALRSAAANVGARGLYDQCLAWRQISLAELTEDGKRHTDRLRGELDRVRNSLLSHRAALGQRERQS